MNSCNIKIVISRFSIQIDLLNNEFIWDTIGACSRKDAVKIFKAIYTQLEYMTDERLEKYIYENLESNPELGLDEYLKIKKEN